MSVMDALEAVYKADPKTAESMIDDIVLDAMADDALDNAELLNRNAAAYVSQRVLVAKRALLRQYANDVAHGQYPDDEVHKAAEWLAGIEAFMVDTLIDKANMFGDDDSSGGPRAKWDEHKHKRGAGGRFARGVNQGKTVNPLQYAAHQRATPLRPAKDKPLDPNTQLPHGLDPKQAEKVQAQYEQADEILREFGATFGAGDRKNVNAIIQFSDSNGEVKAISAPLSEAAHGMPDSAYGPGGLGVESNIISIEIDAAPGANESLQAKVNHFNTLGAMGGQQMAALGSLSESQRGGLTSALMPRGPEEGKLNRLFGRFQSGADALDATGHDKMAAFARFAGTYGPEAEKVMDPRVRQAAYRYRGTEKEPDIDLMRVMNSPQMSQVEAAAREEGEGPMTDAIRSQGGIAAVGRTERGDRPKMMGPLEGALKANLQRAALEEEPFTEDQLNMRVRSDIAAMHLLKKIPMNRMVASLSQKSGNILPSQGVLIDADGDVVSQAVGFGDDTYLPFDYNNIKGRLRGGQYVRTRVQGGLTGEDISAAVNNGARMATVVSSSGVHSIEFDPNLRGARGGSDKARSMYRRYLQILDAVENSGMYAVDIPGSEKSKLRQQAADIVGAREGQEFNDTYAKLESDARAAASDLSEDELSALEDESKNRAAEMGGRMTPQQRGRLAADLYEEMETKARDEKASRLRLNAEGYNVALQTLQQQFPYFIRSVNYEPLAGKGGEPGFLDSRGQQTLGGSSRQRLTATDEGYMRPGGIRASSVQGGFYRTEKPQIGAEGTTGMKKPLGGDRFEAGKPKPPAPPTEGGGVGVAPAEPGAPGAPAAPLAGLNGPVGGPQGGLAQSVSRLSGVAQLERDQTLSELTRVFSTLGAHRTDLTNSPATKSFDDVKDGDNTLVAMWFLNQDNPKAALTDPNIAPRLASALSDRKATTEAFKQSLQASIGGDYFQGDNEFGGQKTAEGAANWVADMALKVVDADLVTQPFVNPVGGKGDPYHIGRQPQALTINGTPINSIVSGKQLNSFMNANKDVAALARSLGTTDGGDDYKPVSAVGQEVSERVKVLQNLDRVIAVARADKQVQAGMPNHIGLFLTDAGIPAAEQPKFTAALQRMNDNKPVVNAKDLADLHKKWPNREAEAMKLQQAWALVSAGRTVAMIEGPGGVGGAPKVPGRQQGDLWVPKAETAKAASTRPASIVRKSRDSSPLAQEISRRRLAGQQFVPTRV
jgi:hypothetical protein